MASAASDPPRFGLVDVNNFYASCEAVFQPKLWGRALVVLSNNDGCVIARSAEAKALGIKMGEPWHLLKAKPIGKDLLALSSNYTLYADMSHRVMQILGAMAPAIEVYSIDECFVDLQGIEATQPLGHDMRSRIRQWTGLPVCVGIASTKTRAKLANHIAKKRPKYSGVFDLETLHPNEQDQLLDELPVNQVWGIGRAMTGHLNGMGINTVKALRDAPPKRLREAFGVVIERIVAELNGASCLSLEMIAPDKKQIIASRSFGYYIQTQAELSQAVLAYAARATEKLRQQHSTASTLSVWVETNPFRPDKPQYCRTASIHFHDATDDTQLIGNAAIAVLKRIYREGYEFKKAGVMLSAIAPKAQRQATLFESAEHLAKRERLNQALDRINRRFGRGSLASAGAGLEKPWSMKREQLTPAYTTRWDELMVAR